jgi:Bifunctional DNA primase/polymerase, N-terminal
MTTFPSDERERAGAELALSALALAEQGQPVLPLNGKAPHGGYGLRHASTDPGLIAAWWREWPAANIGMRCDGLAVLDVDGPAGEQSLRDLQRRFGALPPTRRQTTGKGRHLLYRSATAVVGNSTRPLGNPPGLDIRGGTRGYVVVAPSVHASGRRYAWTDPEQEIAALPASWLEPLTSIVSAQVMTPRSVGLGCERSSAYGHAALASELGRLLRAREGERNERLNESVFRLARLAAGGELALHELEQQALAIAGRLGLLEHEREKTLRTIERALTAGLRYPRGRR